MRGVAAGECRVTGLGIARVRETAGGVGLGTAWGVGFRAEGGGGLEGGLRTAGVWCWGQQGGGGGESRRLRLAAAAV